MIDQTCQTCELIVRRDRGEAPPWDRVVRTPHFDLVHSFNTSLLGWMVVVARRHVGALGELNDAEASELGPLLRDLSASLGTLLECEKTYVMQFAEAEGHHHVHWHVVPRAAEMPREHRGAKVFHYLGVDLDLRVSEESMNGLAEKLRPLLKHFEGS